MRDLLRRQLARVLDDESGAITVDWVVITAVVIGLSLAVTQLVATGSTEMADNVGTYLSEREVGALN